MILNCPSCQARYLVNPVQLGDAGRRVKCVRCHHVWYARRPAETVVPPTTTETQPAAGPAPEPAAGPDLTASRYEVPVDEPGRVPSPDPYPPVSGQLPSTVVLRRSRVPAAFWTLLILLVGAVIVLGAVARDDVVRFYPPAIVAYDSIGLPVDPAVLADHPELQPALRIEGLAVALGDSEDLLVSGAIVNGADHARRLAPLQVTLRDGEGAALASHAVTLASRSLEAGETVDFELVIEDWPDGAVDASVAFATQDPG